MIRTLIAAALGGVIFIGVVTTVRLVRYFKDVYK